MEHGQIGLAHPPVAPYALGKYNRTAVAHDVIDHHTVVVKPDIVEVVKGVFYTPPFAVLIKTGFGQVQVAQTALAVRLAIPEIPGQLLIVHFLQLFQIGFLHFTVPS